MKMVLPVCCWMLSIAVFYGFFFKLAPYICTLIPPGQWQGLMKVGVYFVIAYAGGIGIPFVLIFFSIMMIWNSKHFDEF